MAMKEPAQQPEEDFFVTPAHDKLLRGTPEMPIGLYQVYKASAAQLGRPHYSEKSVRHVKALLRELADHDYVQFDARPTASYRSPYYYVLGNKGIEYLKSIGYSFSDSYRPSKEIGQSYLHLLHKIGLNDVVISAALLKGQTPDYSLAAFKLERELAKNPFHTLWHGKSKGLVPDAFLDLRQLLADGRQRRTPVFIEFDRGTEQEEIIRWKAHAFATMMKTEWYKTQFGINSISVVFITFEGEKRREQLRGWIREELHGEDRSLVSCFLCSAQPQPPDARVWLFPCFYTPFVEDKPIALLGGEE